MTNPHLAALPATITVAAGHIAAGQPEICVSCPIALALTDAIGDPDIQVRVHDDEAVLFRGKRIARAELPPEAVRFIDRFDSGQPVEPFTFTLTWREEGS